MKKKNFLRTLIISILILLPAFTSTPSVKAAKKPTETLSLYKSKETITVYIGQTVKEYRNKHKSFTDLYLNDGKVGSKTTVNFYYRTKKGKVNFYRGLGAYTQFEKGMKLKAIISTDVAQLTPQARYKFRTEGMNMGYNTATASKNGTLTGWMMRPGVVVSVKVKHKSHKHKKHKVKTKETKKVKNHKKNTKKVRK